MTRPAEASEKQEAHVRVAIAGKGGSGKTTIAGTLARLLGRRGRPVLAIDGDTNPNLAQVLGIRTAATDLAALPSDLLVRRADPADPSRVVTELDRPVEELITGFGRAAPDGVRLLIMGRIEHAGAGCKCRAHAIVRNVLGELLARDDAGTADVIVDMEAGLEHLSRGTTRHVDTLLAVAEPYYRSLETARRVCELATELGIPRVCLVANKIRSEAEAEALRGFAAGQALPILAEVPYDEDVAAADLAGQPLLDVASPDSPAVRALAALVDELIAVAAQPTA